MVSKYKPAGRDAILLQVIDECTKLQQCCTQVLRGGVSNNSSLEYIKALDNLSEIMELSCKEMPKPSINFMTKTVKDWFNSTPWREQEEFITTEFDKLIVFNSSLGQNIRNYFKLWAYPWNKQIVNGVDMSPEHPDSVSMRVIENVWREAKNEST